MTVLPISAGAVGRLPPIDGEVERRDGVDEAFERPVVEAGSTSPRSLTGCSPYSSCGEGGVEAPEVDQLAGRVDLGLERRLRLAEHRRGVDRRAPRRRQQLGGLEEHRGAILPRPVRPLALRLRARRRSPASTARRRRGASRPSTCPCVVRHHACRESPVRISLAADDDRDLDALLRHRVEPRLEIGALGRAGRVAADGFVDGGGDGHHPILLAETATFRGLSPGLSRGLGPGRRPGLGRAPDEDDALGHDVGLLRAGSRSP